MKNIANRNVYDDWASGRYPFDRADCGACLSEHQSPLRCSRADHEPLRTAAEKEELVKLIGKLQKTSYQPMIEKIHRTFLKLRKRHSKYWRKREIFPSP